MKNTAYILGLGALLLSLVFGVGACKNRPTRGPSVVTLSYMPSLSDNDVRTAITNAIVERNWALTAQSPGKMDIEYKGYPSTITYGDGQISITNSGLHRKTTNWARRLRLSIQTQIAQLPK